MWRENETEKKKSSPRFRLPLSCSPFSLHPWLFSWVQNICQHSDDGGEEERVQRAWYVEGPAQESVEPLGSARLPCLFALTPRSPRG